ncbi:flagellar biosynthetic protein FliO [Coralloluteibacterium thermophilus]|uniref:Flagellar protein n=1 Tax=Coralloluteibacterium thermophilum TaxID=2707049 RepID=A0ABV9NG17_9GAMM
MSAAAAATGAAAQAGGFAGSAAPSPSIAGGLFALLLVVGLILGLAWLLKRLPGSGFRPTPGLRLVASLHVGPKERLLVVETGGEQLLLGVGAGGIRPLHVLREPIPETPQPQGFAALLKQRTGSAP